MSDAAGKYEELLARLRALGSVLVAYSGGVDSTLLAVAAREALGDRAMSVFAVTDLLSPEEIADAREVAHVLDLPTVEVTASQLACAEVASNPPDRCYHCKLALFELLRDVARARGIAHVADGSAIDDLGDYRPGRRALAELGVISPLAEAGFTKRDIRATAASLGLPNADKPSMACLASRFPYGTPIDAAGLARVAAAEAALRELGLAQVRVRVHGDVARVEVAANEMERVLALRSEVTAAVRAAGFAYVTLDLEGYRTGSMNETLGEAGPR